MEIINFKALMIPGRDSHMNKQIYLKLYPHSFFNNKDSKDLVLSKELGLHLLSDSLHTTGGNSVYRQ